ncbi:MAG: DNA polymerase III subunit gamma/tau [Anaerolineae bacterium]|nr:DNA polymerase III subunit gamma/tau [Anaerolineae bacterium]
MSQALYRKWRPGLWDQVVGQEHIIQTLQNAIRSNRVGHAYLFAGPRGTGKTTTARLLAKAVNCLAEDPAQRPCNQCTNCLSVNQGNFLDLIEIDAASNTSVDDIRDLRDKINFSPSFGKFKVYIIDEVHMLSTAAFNALLKTLEEPPAHAIFILATTEVHKIPATVLSRCQRHEFRRIPVNDIVNYLNEIISGEGLQADPDALVLIARQSTGCMRDAISLLDQLSSTGEKITLSITQSVLGTATHQSVINLTESILNGDTAAGLNSIHQAMDGGTDPRQFARQVVEYLRGLLLIQMGSADQIDATSEQHAQMSVHAGQFERAQLLNALQLFNNAVIENRGTWQPGLLLELALAESIQKPFSAAVAGFERQVVATALPERQTVATSQQVQTAPAQGIVSPARSAPEKEPTAVSQTPPVAAEQAAPRQAPPASAAITSPPAQNASAKGVELDDILRVWGQIRTVIKKRSPQTEALLNSCHPLALKDGMLVLGFASDVVKSKMESNENKDLTSQAIFHILGVNLNIQCTVGSKVVTDTSTLGIEGGGLVSTALNLGGKIVTKKKSSNS